MKNKKRIPSLSLSLILIALAVGLTSRADTLSFGIMGDGGYWNSQARQIQQSMREGNIKRLILPGDNLYDPQSSYEEVWGNWSDFSFDVVALGNHFESYEAEIAYFKMPAEFYAKKPHPDVLFLVVNSDNEDTYKQQTDWLESQLEAAQEKFIFVVYHHPPYTISERHSWKEKKNFQQRARALLHQYAHKIDALIVGHDHIASLVKIGSIPMIVSGAAFEAKPTKPIAYTASDGQKVKTLWLFRDGPHWVRLDIDTDSEQIWLNFVKAEGSRVICSTLLRNSAIWIKDNCLQKRLEKSRHGD